MASTLTLPVGMKLLAGPADGDDANQWSPPPPQNHIPVDQRPEWLRDEALPFLELLSRNVAKLPDKVALSWIEEGGKISSQYTYAEFDAKSRAVAGSIVKDWAIKNGDRVVLVYPPGLEFLVAFVACLRAGVTAVPMYPPNPNDLAKDLPKMERVVTDSDSSAVLTTSAYLAMVRLSSMRFIRWPGKTWHTTDNIKAPPTPTPSPLSLSLSLPPPTSPIAFIQYTSGSTAEPKGVMVGSANIAHNVMFVRRTLRLQESSRFLSWLPQYHDLGLIVAYLSTLSAGASGFYLSPITFIKRPATWIQLLSHHKITHTAAPNFALELCSRKFDTLRDAKGGLDLSPLQSLLNAAEPVRAESIAKWNATFSKFGWRPSAMCPCYGLAEHVVGIVGWGRKVVEVGEGSQRHALHSSGNLATFPTDGRVLAVHPDSCHPCGEGVEGEIWARSQHVTLGYWRKPELTRETFEGKLAPGCVGWDAGTYLRTGDLGFTLGDQLFVTGRIKDVIIIRGKNYYPQDMEKTAEECSDHIRAGCVAAFAIAAPPGTISATNEEIVAIVAEVRSASITVDELEKTTAAIRRAVVRYHGIVVATVALIPPRTVRTSVHPYLGEPLSYRCYDFAKSDELVGCFVQIPKTTSGKIRRRETCSKLTQGALKILNKNIATATQEVVEIQPPSTPPVADAIIDSDVTEVEPDVSIGDTDNTHSQETTAAANESAPTVDDGSKIVEKCDAEEPLAVRVVPDVVAKYAEAGVYISPPEVSTIELGSAKWDGKSIEQATMEILEVSGQEFGAEETLISLGLSSMSAMDIIDLVEHRTGRALEPEEIEVLRVIDLRTLDEGKELPNPLVALEREESGEEMDSTSTALDVGTFSPGQ